jgi:hypothetical protein
MIVYSVLCNSCVDADESPQGLAAAGHASRTTARIGNGAAAAARGAHLASSPLRVTGPWRAPVWTFRPAKAEDEAFAARCPPSRGRRALRRRFLSFHAVQDAETM